MHGGWNIAQGAQNVVEGAYQHVANIAGEGLGVVVEDQNID